MSEKILIVGGVALGPKAASRCKRLMPDAEVTIVDENVFISYGGCGIPYYVSGEVQNLDDLRATPYHTVRDPEFFRSMKGVNVRTQTRALGRLTVRAKPCWSRIWPAAEKKNCPTTSWCWPRARARACPRWKARISRTCFRSPVWRPLTPSGTGLPGRQDQRGRDRGRRFHRPGSGRGFVRHVGRQGQRGGNDGSDPAGRALPLPGPHGRP